MRLKGPWNDFVIFQIVLNQLNQIIKNMFCAVLAFSDGF